MEVHLEPDVQAKLARIAAERGRDAETVVKEAIERFVDYDEWFLREVVVQIDRGETLPHEENGARIERLLADGRRSLRPRLASAKPSQERD